MDSFVDEREYARFAAEGIVRAIAPICGRYGLKVDMSMGPLGDRWRIAVTKGGGMFGFGSVPVTSFLWNGEPEDGADLPWNDPETNGCAVELQEALADVGIFLTFHLV